MSQATLFYFASLRDLMGCGEETLELDPSWTVARLLDFLEGRQPRLRPLRGRYRVAVDLEVADEDRVLGPAREIALIPPVSGGSSWVRLDHEPISVDTLLAAVRRPDCGAAVLFLGTVRDSFQAQPVECLNYTAYEQMARQQMERLAEAAEGRVRPGRVALWHRLGRVEAGDVSVAVAVTSPHRPEAFDTARWLIDELKREVPLWKQEIGPGGACWVEGDARVQSS